MEAVDRISSHEVTTRRATPIKVLIRSTYLDNQLAFSLVTVTWVLGLWVFQFHHGKLDNLLIFGCLYSLLIAPSIAGSHIQDGAEEFSFALPFSKSQIFWTRFLVGFLPLLFFIGLGEFAIKNDLPQKLWGLFFDAGFLAPTYSIGLIENHLPLLHALPFSIFFFSYSCVTLTPNSNSTLYPFLVSLAGLGIIFLLGIVLPQYFKEISERESLRLFRVNSTMLIITSVILLAAASQLYMQKQIGDKSKLRQLCFIYFVIIGLYLLFAA